MSAKTPTKGFIYLCHAAVVVSAVFFAVTGAFARIAIEQGVAPPAITFFRFFIGLLLILAWIGIVRPKLRPRNLPVLVMRGVFNVIAVSLFYWAVKYTTLCNANLLNLTFPAFVALLGPILLGERLKTLDWAMLVLAGIGVYLVVDPRFGHVNTGDLIGLACGFVAGLAVLALRRARQTNSTVTVLLFLLTIGSVLTAPLALRDDMTAYTKTAWLMIALCGTTGVVGQFAMTVAFRYVSAFSGSLTSTVRVVMAAAIGWVWLGEVMGPREIVGAVVLLTAVVTLAMREQRQKPQTATLQTADY